MYGSIPLPGGSGGPRAAPAAASSSPSSAFTQRNAELSRQLHDERRAAHRPQLATETHANGGGDLLKAVTYGGVDGVLTACAMMTGAAGGSLSPAVVLVLGMSNMVADAVSMGIGDYVSTLSYREHVAVERKREEWEFDVFPEGEIEEMVDLYELRGLPREKAVEVIATMAKYKDFFIDIMVIEELGLRVPSSRDLEPWRSAAATATSFFVFGSAPLLVYAALVSYKVTPMHLFFASFATTMMVLFALGTLKARFSAVVWWRSGLEFVALGGAVAAVSYWISSIVSLWV